jgi:uncharacterized membrane protein (DUF4010 family)
MPADPSILGILAATLGGAVVGFEREWSGHARGPEARFGGLRTFTLLGGLSGVAGWCWASGLQAVAVVLVAGAAALVVAGYVAASRVDVDGTTEMAALVVIGAGLLAGTGRLGLASGIIVAAAVLLAEKTRLHGIVARIDDESLRAALRFAAMAVVVLPLLPPGPFGPLGGVRPRELWALVLFFSGLSFAGYLARRIVGPTHGYLVAGMLGGLVSSTSVTLTYARGSRTERGAAGALGAGAVAASTVLFPRVLVTSSVLNPELAMALLPYVAPPFLVGVLASLAGARRGGPLAKGDAPRNPLAFTAAVQMAALFQVVLYAVHVVRQYWGGAGVIVSALVLGLTDVDALTLSMARNAAEGLAVTIAAQALAVGILSNTVLKLLLSVLVGDGRFRTVAGVGLTAMTAAGVVALLVLRFE